MVLQPLGVYAAPITSTSLAETPLQGLNPVKPNIMFTVDDSGEHEPRVHAGLRVGDPTYTGLSQSIYCRDSVVSCGRLTHSPIRLRRRRPLFLRRRSADPKQPISTGSSTTRPRPTSRGRRSDGTDLPYESANPGTWTSVYVNGFAGLPGHKHRRDDQSRRPAIPTPHGATSRRRARPARQISRPRPLRGRSTARSAGSTVAPTRPTPDSSARRSCGTYPR